MEGAIVRPGVVQGVLPAGWVLAWLTLTILDILSKVDALLR